MRDRAAQDWKNMRYMIWVLNIAIDIIAIFNMHRKK